MKKLIVGLMVVGLVGLMAGTAMAASTDTYINLYITPIVTTSLTISATYYYFGSVDVRTTTGSVAALTLTNDGDIDFTIQKEVTADDDWNIQYSSTAKDGFILWAMVSDNQPNHQAFVDGVSSFSNVSLSDLNDLTDTAGTQVEMSRDDTENLWFRLDMPYSVSSVVEKKIMVRLLATSN